MQNRAAITRPTPPTPSARPHLRRTISLALSAVLVLALFAAADATAAKKQGGKWGKRGPGGAKFYKPPKRMPKGHGALIWQRKATKLAPIAGARVNRVVLYTSRSPRSNGIGGKRIAVSGSVSIPRGKAPKGGWPLITYAHGTTGAADPCAPTRVGPNGPVAPYVDYVDPQLESWIAAGYAVARTDYQGLGTPGPHPYLVGVSGGRSILDIAEAARQLDRRIGKRFLIAGHSQGGQAALFAASLARRWTPRLKLRGIVSYAPASHLEEQADLLPALKSPSPVSALAALIFKGASTTSKSIEVSEFLTPLALALYPQVNITCLPQLTEPDSIAGLAPASLLDPGADLGPLDAALAEMNPAVKIEAPILLAQGLGDTTVLPQFTDLLNGELTELGNSVDYVTFPGVVHSEVVAAAEDEAMAFFKKRLPPKRSKRSKGK